MVERENLSKYPELPLRIEPETLKFKPLNVARIATVNLDYTVYEDSKGLQ